MSSISKKRSAVFTLGVLITVIAMLYLEWMAIKATVHNDPAQMFAIVGIVSAVTVGILAGRFARNWLHRESNAN